MKHCVHLMPREMANWLMSVGTGQSCYELGIESFSLTLWGDWGALDISPNRIVIYKIVLLDFE